MTERLDLTPDRRRWLRQKVHGPAFASFDGVTGGMVLDLSEQGMAMQTAAPVEAFRYTRCHLNLQDPATHVETTGYVAWADALGRAGVRFSDLPEEARRRLRQWLTANATAPSRKAPKLSFDEPMWAVLGVSSPANGRQPLAISLEAESGGSTEHGPNGNSRTVQYEFNSLGSDLNAALKLISERACSITRGSGSAIAIANRNGMRCRARVGENAPPVGTELDISCGLSGKCVSGGKALRCDDTENDPRVDFETCQLLGIRSVLAAPIRYDQRTVGVLEVFSNHPFAFDEGDLAVAERLAQTVILTMTRAGAL
jgi:GAF domain-containing protein